MASVRTMLTAAAIGAASLSLSACVIVADSASDNAQIMTIEQAKSAPDYALLRSFSADGRQVQAKVWSTCAGTGDFDVALVDQVYAQSLTIRQRPESLCQGEARELSLSWSYEALGLNAAERVVVKNQIVL